jgi:hypothetical protein
MYISYARGCANPQVVIANDDLLYYSRPPSIPFNSGNVMSGAGIPPPASEQNIHHPVCARSGFNDISARHYSIEADSFRVHSLKM